jgi:hypothetical protein
MRLAAQAKQGYYPANSKAIQELTKHLYCRAPDPSKKFDTINVLDPCAGKGVAIRDLAVGLGVPEDHVYTVELDGGRYEDIKALMPKSQFMTGPAGFMGVQITGHSFGLVYCNPPFDNELGGGKREEQAFTEASTRKLVVKGILVLVCPFKALDGNREFVEFIDSNYEEVAVYKFPDGYDDEHNQIRPYNEIVVIGKKRSAPIPKDAVEKHGCLHRMNFRWRGYVEIPGLTPLGGTQPSHWVSGRPSYDREEHIRTWEIPHSWKPHIFKKTMFTEAELDGVIDGSPLNRLLDEVVIPPPNAPPLPLDKGHLGLILASGMLDGVVQGPHGVHVVRGSSHKVDYHNKEMSSNEVNPDSGAVTTKDVFSQRMITVIRVVEQDGRIFTHSNEPAEKDLDDQECDE